MLVNKMHSHIFKCLVLFSSLTPAHDRIGQRKVGILNVSSVKRLQLDFCSTATLQREGCAVGHDFISLILDLFPLSNMKMK